MRLSDYLQLPIAEPDDFTTNFPVEIDAPRTDAIDEALTIKGMGSKVVPGTYPNSSSVSFENPLNYGGLTIDPGGNSVTTNEPGIWAIGCGFPFTMPVGQGGCITAGLNGGLYRSGNVSIIVSGFSSTTFVSAIMVCPAGAVISFIINCWGGNPLEVLPSVYTTCEIIKVGSYMG